MLLPLTLLTLIAGSDNQLGSGYHTRTLEAEKRTRTYLVRVPPEPGMVRTPYGSEGSIYKQLLSTAGYRRPCELPSFACVYAV